MAENWGRTTCYVSKDLLQEKRIYVQLQEACYYFLIA